MHLIPKCKTEFGKRNPVNYGIMLALELTIDVSLFSVFRFYSKNDKWNNLTIILETNCKVVLFQIKVVIFIL